MFMVKFFYMLVLRVYIMIKNKKNRINMKIGCRSCLDLFIICYRFVW